MTPLEKIKFRAWGKCEKKMYFNVQNIYDPCGGEYPRADCFGHVLNTRISEICCCESEHAEDDDFAFDVMQSTGLLDKNRKEIYEGDIVVCKFLSGFDCEDKYEIAHENNNRDEGEGVSFYVNPKIVEFKNGEFTPREEYYQCSDGYYSWRTFDIEVLGNIYENPELLK